MLRIVGKPAAREIFLDHQFAGALAQTVEDSHMPDYIPSPLDRLGWLCSFLVADPPDGAPARDDKEAPIRTEDRSLHQLEEKASCRKAPSRRSTSVAQGGR